MQEEKYKKTINIRESREMENKNKYLQMLKTFMSNVWYVIALVLICTVIICLIVNWEKTMLVIGNFISIMMPFIIGLFFAYLIKPFVNVLLKALNKIKKRENSRIYKAICICVAYIVVIGLITILIVYIFPQIRDSIKELGASLEKGFDYVTNNQDKLNKLIPYVSLGSILGFVKDNLMGSVVNFGSTIVPYVYQVSSSFLSSLYNAIFGMVISIYMVWDSDNLAKSAQKVVYALSPKGKEEGIWITLCECNNIFNGFLIGKAIDSLIIGILCFIAMSILQLPYALLISLIVGVTNMIPYFGPCIGAIPGVLIYLFIDPKLSLIFGIMVLILQQFDGWYLGPKILGDQTGIKPLWVIFGITVGGAYFGVLGMFLGVPIVAVIKYLFELLIARKLKNKNIDLSNTK